MRIIAISHVMLIMFLAATLVLASIARAATWGIPSMIAENCALGQAPLISGDGSKIAFTGYNETKEPPPSGWAFEMNIYVVNSDGTGLTQLTNNTRKETDSVFYSLSISDDGSKIAFSCSISDEKHSSSEIFVINSDGTGLTQLTDNPENDFSVLSSNPSISGDGSKIAFQRMNFKTWDRGIFVINSNGTGEKMLTNSSYFAEYPSISDDGLKITFTGGDDFDWQIFVINSDGTGLTQLTSNKDNCQHMPLYGPSISGDGSKVAFMGWDGGCWELFVVNSDGSGLKQLTDNSWLFNEYTPPFCTPSISGDGSKIAFCNFVESDLENPRGEVFVINSDGTGLTQLTNNTKWNTGPSICDNGERMVFRACFETDVADNDLFMINCLSGFGDENDAESTLPIAMVVGGILPVAVGVMVVAYLKSKKSW